MGSNWTIQSWRCFYSVEKRPYFRSFAATLFLPNFLLNLFHHHIILVVRKIETRLSAVKHLVARQTFLVSTSLQVQSRRHNWILLREVVGIGCCNPKASQPIARSWASASLWVLAPFCKCFLWVSDCWTCPGGVLIPPCDLRFGDFNSAYVD
jgi:hypothetical protein